MENLNKIKDDLTRATKDTLLGNLLNHEDLLARMKAIAQIMYNGYDLSDDFFENAVCSYEREFGSKTFKDGDMLVRVKGKDLWLYKAKEQMVEEDHGYENRYKRYLQVSDFDDAAIKNILKSSEKILAQCADPNSTEKTKGLVIGDVQSGKTSNYLALSNMACDYGYKVILILAGLNDSLRIQTQERVDEGLIGAVSSTIKDEIHYIGVGKDPTSYYAVPLSNDENDFSPNDATISDYKKPLILVVKKNKKVLTAVDKWLKPGINISGKSILIIDDECDNASVNTAKGATPTAINGLIRKIFNNFNCAAYVGFTATPFANIFINHKDEDGNSDLFPNDFIYRLYASDDEYFGAHKVFKKDENGEYRYIRYIDEHEKNFLTIPHKKDFVYKGLSDSLKEAICNFLIVNCIRTYRGYGTSHRTMMINITPFNTIQSDIEFYVNQYLTKLKNTIWQYDNAPLEKFLKDKEMHRIYELYLHDPFYNYESDFDIGKKINEELTFEELKSMLYDEITKFKVAVINNKNKNKFNYDDEELGARLIAIGGYVLSRGLTLKGLMISYLSRSSIAYDTLLQMARWFGYRPHYEDLCRVYMSKIYTNAFTSVIEAVENLDEQIKIMHAQGKKPEDFGLMVRESPDTLETKLIITQRAKMRNSKVITTTLNYSGVDIDTSKLFTSPEINKRNIQSFRELYDELILSGYNLEIKNNRHMFIDVSPNHISRFIKKLIIPLENRKFDKENISDFIDNNDCYPVWDIVIATGRDSIHRFNIDDKNSLPSVQRKFLKRKEENIIRISGNNNKILDPGIFNSGLTQEQIDEAKKIASNREKNKNIIAKDYLSVSNRKPLLVIMPMRLSYDEDVNTERSVILKANKIIEDYNDLVLGVGIGFAGKSKGAYCSYRLNKIKEEEFYHYDIEEEDVDEEL